MVPGLDVERVGAWLEANVDGVRGPFTVELIGGGRSNLTYTVTGADGRRLVVRRPPLGHVLATAHDMAREHRIITAIGPTAVPVPPTLGLCTDEAVNGAPFYVMGHVDGVVLDTPVKGEQLEPAVRLAASHDLVDVLADLHAVDVDAVGLGDLARRDGYIERQLKRWSTQWANSRTRDLPAIDEVAERLATRVPRQREVVVAHGDYRFGNCLTDPASGRIAAVLDWELCTLGDPLADVGYLGVYWTDPGGDALRPNDPVRVAGLPHLRRPARALRHPHRARRVRHRLLRRVLVVAPGRDQRGRLRPLPARGDGGPGPRPRRAGDVQARHGAPGRVGPGGGAPPVVTAAATRLPADFSGKAEPSR